MEEKRALSRYPSGGSPSELSRQAQEEDRALVRRAQQGDSQAMTELYVRYQRKVLNFLYRLTGSRPAAEDLTQETFVRVVRHLPAYRPTGAVGGWIYRIARNLALNRFRHERVAQEVSLEQPVRLPEAGEEEAPSLQDRLADSGPGPERQAECRELESIVQAALAQIQPIYREAVILCDVQGCSYQEAAEILGCPIDTVASRLARGRARLAELLGYLRREL